MSQTYSSRKEEDELAEVLGRFRAWNNSVDQDAEPQPQAAEAYPGLREISYEEAVGANRVRRMPERMPPSKHSNPAFGQEATRDRSLGAVARPAAGKEPEASGSGERRIPAMRMTAARDAKPVKVAKTYPPASEMRSALAGDRVGRRSESRTLRTAKRKPAVPQAPLRAREEDGIRLSYQVPPAQKPAARTRDYVGAEEEQVERRRSVGPRSKAGETLAMRSDKHNSPSQGTSAPANTVAAAAFRAVMEESLKVQEGRREVSSATGRGRRTEGARRQATELMQQKKISTAELKSVAMKLRLTPREHAEIKAGATEAGVTLAAYMRQCTLDVQVLRGMLIKTIADLQTSTPSSSQAGRESEAAASPSRIAQRSGLGYGPGSQSGLRSARQTGAWNQDPTEWSDEPVSYRAESGLLSRVKSLFFGDRDAQEEKRF